MKKVIAFALVLCMLLAFAACSEEAATPQTTAQETTAAPTVQETTPENILQEVHDAGTIESLLQPSGTVYIRDELDGELFGEVYLTNDYIYKFIPSDEGDWVELVTDEAAYYFQEDQFFHYVYITPDGMGDFTSTRADRVASAALSFLIEEHAVESVTENEGKLIVKTHMSEQAIAESPEEFGILSGKFEHVLDATTRELISITSQYVYNDGTEYCLITNVNREAEAPELAQTILGFASQTENLRNVTIVSNPGTEKEESNSLQVAKGLILGFQYEEDQPYTPAFFTDAACTVVYDPFADTDSDLTIYVKWSE